MVMKIAAKPMSSAVEKLVPSQQAEKTAAATGSVTPIMDARTGPASRTPARKKEKAITVPKITIQAKDSHPAGGRVTS